MAGTWRASALLLTLGATAAAERIETNFDFDWLFYLSENPGYNRCTRPNPMQCS
jgi:hypothetical protein